MKTIDEIISDSDAKRAAEAAARAAKAAKARLGQSRPQGGESAVKHTAIDPQRLIGVVDPAEFNEESVWNTFHALTFEWTNPEREKLWFDICDLVRPNTYQYLFTELDWRTVYKAFTGRNVLPKQAELGLGGLGEAGRSVIAPYPDGRIPTAVGADHRAARDSVIAPYPDGRIPTAVGADHRAARDAVIAPYPDERLPTAVGADHRAARDSVIAPYPDGRIPTAVGADHRAARDSVIAPYPDGRLPTAVGADHRAARDTNN